MTRRRHTLKDLLIKRRIKIGKYRKSVIQISKTFHNGKKCTLEFKSELKQRCHYRNCSSEQQNNLLSLPKYRTENAFKVLQDII